MSRKAWLLVIIFVLLVTSVVGPMPQSKAQQEEAALSAVEVYTDKWGTAPKLDQSPEIDGVLDDAVWQEAHSLPGDFLTPYYNETAETNPEVKLFYDEQYVYLSFEAPNTNDSIVHFEVLVSAEAYGDTYYRIPVKIKDQAIPYVNDFGPQIEDLSNVETAVHKESGTVSAEIAVPLASFGVDTITEGEEWRLNAIVQHEMGTEPFSSWIPIRTSTNWYSGSSSARIEANITDESRLGTVYMGIAPEAWEPDQLSVYYTAFNEKEVRIQGDGLSNVSNLGIHWKAPLGDWQSIEELDVEIEAGLVTIHVQHPAPDDKGLYQMKILPDRDQETNILIVSFDRHGLIEAGNALYPIAQIPEEDKLQVSPEPASDEVNQLLDLIPDRTGFRFTGLPDQSALHPDNLYTWNPNNPEVMTSQYSTLTWPNDQYPEDQVMTVRNRKGELVEYPYYEDESGQRYFITAHMWHKQREHVTSRLAGIASQDPLGAARLLYRFAEVFEGWVPTNEYPRHNQPLDFFSGPPYTYWGGLWTRWSTADLGATFQAVANAFKTVRQTNAFDVLSQEVGEDVEQKLIKDMFEPTMDYYRSFPIHYNNMEYNNALGLIRLGEALNDPSYIHEAVEWAEDFTTNTYLFDGFFQETTLSYHAQSTNGINTVLAALRGWSDPGQYVSPRTGMNLQELNMNDRFPVLNNAVEIPNKLVYPDGKYFPSQNAWAASRSSNPILDAGSFILPASGVARMARGIPEGAGSMPGIIYDFPALEISSQSVGHLNIGGTLQLEANEEGHHITFSIDVPKTDTYAIELKPFRAGSYGQYDVLIDGDKIADVNFYGLPGGARDFESIATVELTQGTHELTFQNTGKNEESTNYKMGIIQLALLDEEAQSGRDGEENEEGNPTQLYMTFHPRYGHHHMDPLNLTLYANGQELLPDIGYSHTFYGTWTRSALGHNTVVVDGQDMVTTGSARDGGNIDVFAPVDGGIHVMRANQENAYEQTEQFSREPWLIRFPNAENNEGYVLDLFRVSGGDRHEYTLQGDANHDASFETSLDLQDYGPYLLPEGTQVRMPEAEIDQGSAGGHYYAYMHVRDVKKADITDGRYDLNLVTEDKGEQKSRMKITGLVEPGSNELFLGESPSLRATRLQGTSMDNNNEAVKYMMPKMVLRREGTNLTSYFVTVMEPYASQDAPQIEQIERLQPEQFTEGDLAVKVTYGDTTDIILSSTNPDQPLVVDDMTLEGKMGMIRLIDGEVHDMYLIGGTLLQKGNVQVTDVGPITGTITNVSRQAAGDGLNALVTNETVPADQRGNTIVVTHPDGKTHGYKIKNIIAQNDQTFIELDGMDPGFVINGDGASELKFYPFTEWSGETTYRIENIVHETPHVDASISSLQATIASLEADGAFSNDQAARALTMHLTALGHFEQQGAHDKIFSHMQGFYVLLEHQRTAEWISEAAYQTLKYEADAWMRKWQRDEVLTMVTAGRTMIAAGERTEVSWSARLRDGTPIQLDQAEAMELESRDTSVVQVEAGEDGSFQLLAVSPGTARITMHATFNGLTIERTFTLTVTETLLPVRVWTPVVTESGNELHIELQAENVSDEQQSLLLIATIDDANQNVWKSSETNALLDPGAQEQVQTTLDLSDHPEGSVVNIYVWDNEESAQPYAHKFSYSLGEER